MPVVTPDEFAGWLRRLDGDALTAFVADLYADRGESVAVRDDGAVVLGDGDRVLSPVSGRRRLRRPSVAPDADVVVAARPTPALLRRAARTDASVVGPAELRNIALYGLDRRDAERLFREHFDASPVVDARDPDDSLDRHAALGRVGDSLGVGVIAVVLAVLAVAVLFGPFGLALSPTDDAAGSQPDSGDGSTDSATARTEAESFPPGIAPTGVTNPERLAAAHADAVVGRSYRLVVSESGTENWEGEVWGDVWKEAAVESPRRFRYIVTGSVRGEERDAGANASGGASGPDDPTETAGGDGTAAGDGDGLVHYTAYADGQYTYVRNERGDGSVSRFPVRLDGNGHGPFERRTAAAVERYLNATRTSVAREAESEPDAPYHVVATGTPEAFADPENVSNYRAEARVDPDGFVRTLTVSYAVTDGGETRKVRYHLSYSGVDAVELSPPPWYERARGATESESPPPMSTPDRTPVNRTGTATRADDARAPTTTTGSNATAPRFASDRRYRFTPSDAPQFP
ncbi:hypothetical protein C474_02306 [Halogeometricum pallidum JCM 14848]|uniref:Uncharacterized protein n=1 Tax=Halogeometricum pallidum JCM 14848 TaxID=1227487 RepID=M0DGC8_HALPD|nr:hypothetical protein [Halogeometricum pallidum]ELZ34500.1 hypothetical protein C474_02306 [Halogeometricum pallidum JCM 14848]